MPKPTATEQRARRAIIDEAKAELSYLFRSKEDGLVTEEEYRLKRLPFLEIIGTRAWYDDEGNIK